MPRNPILSKLFRFARLSENAGYGIDKMLLWEQKRGAVEFNEDIVSSTITFFLDPKDEDLRFSIKGKYDQHTDDEQKTTTKTTTKILNIISENPKVTYEELANLLGMTKDGVYYHINKLRTRGVVRRTGGTNGGHWEVMKIIDN